MSDSTGEPQVPSAELADIVPDPALAKESGAVGTIQFTAAEVSDVPFARSAAAETKWAAIRGKLDEVSVALGLDGPERAYFKRIEAGFTYSKTASDTDFQPLHVEPLLDQAADLLERAIRERGQWDEIAAKAVQLSLELSEYQALDAIHKEEEAAGVYLLDSKTSAADLTADGGFVSSMNSAASQQGTVESHIDDTTQHYGLLNAEMKAAWTGALPSYLLSGSTVGSYPSYKYGDENLPVYDHQYNAARTKFWFEHKISSFSAGAQKHAYIASKQAVELRLDAVRYKDAWNGKNVGFRKRRTIAARNIQDIKAKLATDADGVLNYAKRLPAIRKRFQDDFRNALARMNAAQSGIVQLFDFPTPIPTNTGSIDYFDDCLAWCREAIHWLVRFSRREQNSVLTLSLRDLLGEDAWKNLIKDRKATFNVPADQFADMRCVRLRGLGACVVPETAAARTPIWRMRCTVPEAGAYTQLDGSAVSIDQTAVPSVRFGRVTTRQALRETDVLGASALLNASPIGSWTITLDSAIGEAALADIEFDLHIAFRVE